MPADEGLGADDRDRLEHRWKPSIQLGVSSGLVDRTIAVTSHGGDYTVHVVIGVDPENRMYLLDLWRGQTSSDIWIEAWCDLVCKWKPAFWAEEHGQISMRGRMAMLGLYVRQGHHGWRTCGPNC